MASVPISHVHSSESDHSDEGLWKDLLTRRLDFPEYERVISPLMALNDDPLFKRLLSASDEFKIYSVYGTAFVSAPTAGTV